MKLHPKFKPARRTVRKTQSARPGKTAEAQQTAFGFGRLWNPNLVDRLQIPLTRFRY